MMERKEEYISAKEAVDTIEEVVGKFPGYRRAHAKGIGFDAVFEPSGNAVDYTKALHLQQELTQTIVRFSHSSPSPEKSAGVIPVKGMAVRFLLPEDAFTNLTMVNVSVFPTKTPEAFIRLIKVMERGSMSFSEKWQALRQDPEFHTLPALFKELKRPVSFAEETYSALHSYYLVNEAGERQAVRFSWVPVVEEEVEELVKSDGDLETELLARMDVGKVQFRLMIQLAEKEDLVDDPSVVWAEDRIVIDAGLLTLASVREDGADSLMFDPTVEVDGLECSDDPILHYRSGVYEESVKRRLSETRE